MRATNELPAAAFRRMDESPDASFYTAPRFVAHIDDGAIAAVTALYRELLPAGGDVLERGRVGREPTSDRVARAGPQRRPAAPPC